MHVFVNACICMYLVYSRGEQVTGPLTQRLMAALVEENVLPAGADTGAAPATSAAAAAADARPVSAMMRNGVTLERRIRQELIDQGLLSDDEDELGNAPPEDDEILSEIMRVRTELSTIAKYNYTELQTLRQQAKTEMRRLEVKRQLDVVDQKIVEMYMRVADIKQQKGALSDEERAEVLRLTGEQKRLSDKLETFGRMAESDAI